MKPSEAAKVIQLTAGEVIEEVPELTEVEKLLARWNILRGSDILALPPQEWKVKGWLPSDSVTAIYAAPGVGKSFYALSLALEMARGGEWLGTPLEAVPVLYVAGEKLTTIRDRQEAWSIYHGEPLPSNLLTPDFSESRTPQLTNPAQVEALCQMIRENSVRFVVLDTYASMTEGIEENASGATGQIMGALSEIRKATNGGMVQVVHHSGKDSSKGLRGSTAFLASVDMTIEIASGGEGRMSARVQKSNAGASPLPEWYQLEIVPLPNYKGESRSSAILKSTGAPALGGNLASQIIDFFRTNYPTDSASKSEILTDLNEAGTKCSDSHLRRHLKALVEAGALVPIGKGAQARYSLPKE
jgi:hypothetical protein